MESFGALRARRWLGFVPTGRLVSRHNFLRLRVRGPADGGLQDSFVHAGIEIAREEISPVKRHSHLAATCPANVVTQLIAEELRRLNPH